MVKGNWIKSSHMLCWMPPRNFEGGNCCVMIRSGFVWSQSSVSTAINFKLWLQFVVKFDDVLVSEIPGDFTVIWTSNFSRKFPLLPGQIESSKPNNLSNQHPHIQITCVKGSQKLYQMSNTSCLVRSFYKELLLNNKTEIISASFSPCPALAGCFTSEIAWWRWLIDRRLYYFVHFASSSRNVFQLHELN